MLEGVPGDRLVAVESFPQLVYGARKVCPPWIKPEVEKRLREIPTVRIGRFRFALVRDVFPLVQEQLK